MPDSRGQSIGLVPKARCNVARWIYGGTVKVIYKFPVEASVDEQGVEMPQGAQILCAQWQESTGRICLWALCDLRDYGESVKERHIIRIFATGQPIDEKELIGLAYLSTVQISMGLVFHVFRKPFTDDVSIGDGSKVDPSKTQDARTALTETCTDIVFESDSIRAAFREHRLSLSHDARDKADDLLAIFEKAADGLWSLVREEKSYMVQT